MMNPNRPTNDRRFPLPAIAGAGVLTGLLAIGALTGCAEEEAPPPAPPPVVHAPAPRIDPMAGIELDPRVQWPEEMHPSSPEIARAVAALANAIARADAEAFIELLQEDDALLTRELVNFGLWQKEMAGIEGVRVCVLNELSPSTIELGIGLQTDDFAYLLGFGGISVNDWQFYGLGITDIEAPRVAMLDGSPLTRPTIPSHIVVVNLDRPTNPSDDFGGGGGGGEDWSPPSSPDGPPSGPPQKPRRHYR